MRELLLPSLFLEQNLNHADNCEKHLCIPHVFNQYQKAPQNGWLVVVVIVDCYCEMVFWGVIIHPNHKYMINIQKRKEVWRIEY